MTTIIHCGSCMQLFIMGPSQLRVSPEPERLHEPGSIPCDSGAARRCQASIRQKLLQPHQRAIRASEVPAQHLETGFSFHVEKSRQVSATAAGAARGGPLPHLASAASTAAQAASPCLRQQINIVVATSPDCGSCLPLGAAQPQGLLTAMVCLGTALPARMLSSR